MNRFNLAWCLVAFCPLLASCSKETTAFEFSRRGLVLDVYEGAEPKYSVELDADSELAALLEHLIADRKDQWRPSRSAGLPRMVVRAPEFKVYFSGDRIIVECRDQSKKWVRLEAGLSAEDVRAWDQAVRKQLNPFGMLRSVDWLCHRHDLWHAS